MLAATVLGITWQLVVNSVFAQMLPSEFSGSLGLVIPLPGTILAVGGIVVFVLLSYITVVAMRTFVAGESTHIPSEFRRRQIPWVIGNLIVGGAVFGVLTLLGTLLLVIPGIIVYISLLFMSFFIAVEDENFVSAMVESWHLTRGNWIRLFLLLAVIIIPLMLVFGVLSVAISLVAGPNSVTAQIVSGLISMPISILMLGILADGFIQLRDDQQQPEAESHPNTGVTSPE